VIYKEITNETILRKIIGINFTLELMYIYKIVGRLIELCL